MFEKNLAYLPFFPELHLNTDWVNISRYQLFKLYRDFKNDSLGGCSVCGFSRRDCLKTGFETYLPCTIIRLELSDIVGKVRYS